MRLTHSIALASAAAATFVTGGPRFALGSDPSTELEPQCDSSALLTLLRTAVNEEVMPGQATSVATACMKLMGREDATVEERCACFGPIPRSIVDPVSDQLRCRPTPGSEAGQTVWAVWSWCDANWTDVGKGSSGGEGGEGRGKTTTSEAAAGVASLTSTTLNNETTSNNNDTTMTSVDSTSVIHDTSTNLHHGDHHHEHEHAHSSMGNIQEEPSSASSPGHDEEREPTQL